jgi:hypothetical protein
LPGICSSELQLCLSDLQVRFAHLQLGDDFPQVGASDL